MPTDVRLIDLLDRWKQAEAQGQAVDPAALCAGCPELRPEVERLHRVESDLEHWLVTLEIPETAGRPANPLPADAGLPAIAGYEVKALLGAGGMGAVYRALDLRLQREVALKVIRPEKLSAELLGRFQREARAVAALDHPHIVGVHEVGEFVTAAGAAAPYLAMEYVPGGTLETHAVRPLPCAEAARIGQLLAGALAHAHRRGVVHRDLKPANVLIAAPAEEAALNAGIGRPKVSDFGLALQQARPGTEVGEDRLTQSGGAVGTPAYMAPEQIEGHPGVGAAADVYALGVILHRLLAGRLPFAPASRSELLYQIVHVPPPPLEGVPADLGRIVVSCLAKGPRERPSAADLAARLKAWQLQGETVPLPGKRTPARRIPLGWAGAAVVALAVALLAVWRPWRSPEVASGPGPEASAPRVKRLWLECFHVEGEQSQVLGTVSADLDARPLFTLPFATRVFVRAEFTGPAHAYLIAFNADGKEQLLWPVNAAKQPDRTVRPPRVKELKYPNRLGPTGRPVTFILDDEPRGGLQAFAVVLSREPLPAYEQWRKGRGLPAWRRLAGISGPFVADGEGVYPVLPGKGLVRGGEEELGAGPDLRPLSAALKDGVDGVEMLAVPMEAQP